MKKSTIGTLLIVSTLSLLSFGFLSSQQALGNNDNKFWDFSNLKRPGVIPVNNENYKEECGSCHMAYSPGLLPKQSWIKVMNNLEEHYGDNAELSSQQHTEILAYLTTNAADFSKYKRSRKIMATLDESRVTDRITLTPYFIKKHDEIPQKFVIDNPKVGSFSQCNLCHTNTKNGSFSEDEVSIPGVGYWHD